MTLNVLRWIGWALVYAGVTPPGLFLANWVERALHWTGLGPDILFKCPAFVLGGAPPGPSAAALEAAIA